MKILSTIHDAGWIDRDKKTTDFARLHQSYIEEWDLDADNIILEEDPHSNENFQTYLGW